MFCAGTVYFETKMLLNISAIKKAMIVFIFIAVTVIASPVHGSLQITNHEYPLLLQHYTKLISEEHFTARRPLVIALPLSEEDSTNKEVGYLIDEL